MYQANHFSDLFSMRKSSSCLIPVFHEQKISDNPVDMTSTCKHGFPLLTM